MLINFHVDSKKFYFHDDSFIVVRPQFNCPNDSVKLRSKLSVNQIKAVFFFGVIE